MDSKGPDPVGNVRTGHEGSARLSGGVIWIYSLPVIGFGFAGVMMMVYLMKFSTDVLLIAPAAMGALFGFSRFWDAISDPAVGYLSDQTRSPLGRRRSWLFASAIPVGIGVVMLWSPPLGLGELGLVLWMASAFFIYETASTAFHIPHGALGVELTLNYHERTRLFGYRHLIAAIGMSLSIGGIWFLTSGGDPRARAVLLSSVVGVALASTILFSTWRLRERPDYQNRGGKGIFRSFSDVFRNEHARLLLVVYAIETLGAASIAMLVPYITQYVLGIPGITTTIIVLYFIPQFVFTPFWIAMSRRFGKKELWLFSMSLTTLGYFGLFFVSPERAYGIWLLTPLLGFAGGCGAVVAPSIKADIIDYDEYQTGERKEGAYLAVWNFIRKGAAGITAMLTGFVLQATGFEPNVEQSEATKLGMRIIFGLIPATCYVIGTLIFLRFRFNERELASVHAALDARRADGRSNETNS